MKKNGAKLDVAVAKLCVLRGLSRACCEGKIAHSPKLCVFGDCRERVAKNDYFYYHIFVYKKNLLFLLIFAFFSFFAFSNVQSEILFNSFLENGLLPEKQTLLNTESTDFPYNVILDNSKDLNIVVSVDDALLCANELTELSDFFNIVCTTNDFSKLENAEYSFDGTKTFLEKSSFAQNPTIILSFEGKNDVVKVIPGTKGFVASKYCLEKLLLAFNKTKNQYSFQSKSISLYKFGLVTDDDMLKTFFESGCTPIKIDLGKQNLSSIKDTLLVFANDYDFLNKENQDFNYSLIFAFNKSLFLSEFSLTLIFLISLSVALFVICMLSFMFGQKGRHNKRIIKKYWPITPLFLVVFICFFYLSQFLVLWIFSNYELNIIFAFCIKMILACIFISILFLFAKELELPQKEYAYSYLLAIVCLVNIFIFTSICLPLLLLFTFEFVIAYFSQRIKKPLLLCFPMILMIVPFIPTINGLFSGINQQNLQIIVKSNFFVNTALSLIILPFAFMTRRIVLSIKNKSTKKIPLFVKIVIFAILFCATLLCGIIKNRSIKKIALQNDETLVEIVDDELFYANLLQNKRFSICKNILTINSDQNIDLYKLIIFNKSDFPLYTANFPFEYDLINHCARLKLAENPPNPLIIEFVTDSDSDFEIQIEGFSRNGNSISKKLLQKKVDGTSDGKLYSAR